ncbi:MAG: hypothetical protein KIT09_35940 [Bryobacteraceae bacterium]|nr:hypothetical protein [Bryobacteraceae bacterium]
MKATLGNLRQGSRLLILVLGLTAASLAQMGGGMMGGDHGNGYGGMMGNSLGGMMGGSLSGMMGGGSGLAVGTDGTLYITRSATPQAQGQAQTASTQLAALDSNGNAKWTLSINANRASQPTLGKDGTLFVTTSDWMNWMYDWMYNRSTPAAGSTSNLLIIKPAETSASVAVTVPLAGHVASAPQIAADSAGGYVVYVVTVDGFHGAGFNTSTTSGTYLNAFSPTGTLKYRVQLSQGGYGMMGL